MRLKTANSVKEVNIVPDTCLMSLIKSGVKEEAMEEERKKVVVVGVVVLGSKLASGHQWDVTRRKECSRGSKLDLALKYFCWILWTYQEYQPTDQRASRSLFQLHQLPQVEDWTASGPCGLSHAVAATPIIRCGRQKSGLLSISMSFQELVRWSHYTTKGN